MEFEWDEAKQKANLAKHGLGFDAASKLWLGPTIDPSSMRVANGEERRVAIGLIGDDDMVIAVIYTWRGRVRRLISARRARQRERADYQTHFGRGR